MQYDYMGASNLRVSKICLGTMHFGGVTPEAESHAIMDKALEMGINFFDTANVYGGPAGTGATETVIGNWFAQGGGRRDQVVLASKTYNAMNRPAIAADPNDDKGSRPTKCAEISRLHSSASRPIISISIRCITSTGVCDRRSFGAHSASCWTTATCSTWAPATSLAGA